MKSAAAQDWRALHFANAKPQADWDIVMIAVAQQGHLLQRASEELQADRDFTRNAVAQDLRMLQLASEELQADRDTGMIRSVCCRGPARSSRPTGTS